MYCTCGKTNSYTVNMVDGKANWDWWVCSTCLLPSFLVFKGLTNMRVPYGAVFCASVYGKRNGQNIITWKMEDGSKKQTVEFHSYPRKVNMDAGESLLFRTWELLDSKVDIIMAPPPGDDAAVIAARCQARGICETLAILMQPFITDADDAVRHAIKRWHARKNGTYHEVPGLSEHIWDPTKNWDGSDRVLAGAKPQAKVRRLGKQLSPEEKVSVKSALEAGMFTPQQLADTFKVSLQQIEECR
jgi:hypothetical protein